MANKKLLLFVDWFYPGYKAGGPIQSCRNIIEVIKNEFEIYIFTSDRDIGDIKPYKGIKANNWIPFNDHVKIFYANEAYCTVKNIQKIINTVNPGSVYLNSMFSFSFTIKPLWALRKKKNSTKIVLAPRGMLHQGAVKVKKTKKLFFLNAVKNVGLTNKVIFHATDEQEVNDIKKYFKKTTDIALVQNIPHINTRKLIHCKKNKGEASFVFISRMHRKKNIAYFIDLLPYITKHTIVLDIYGYIEDEPYKQKCKKAIQKLPANVSVNFKDAIPNDAMFKTISQHHVFVLPTLGENFGHAIFEALSAGRPVLISDQTPWHNLTVQQIGWDISLDQPNAFIKAIEQIVNWEQHEFDDWCKNAYNFAQDFSNYLNLQQKYINLFA